MAEFDILTTVKTALGLQGNSYFDATLQIYIDEVKQYLINGGCSQATVDNKSSAGVIVRGVADLWNNGSGNAELSPYFKERAIQLSCIKAVAENDV